MDANPISKIKLTKDFADFTLVSVQRKLKIINEPDEEQFTGWNINLPRLCDSRWYQAFSSYVSTSWEGREQFISPR